MLLYLVVCGCEKTGQYGIYANEGADIKLGSRPSAALLILSVESPYELGSFRLGRGRNENFIHVHTPDHISTHHNYYRGAAGNVYTTQSTFG